MIVYESRFDVHNKPFSMAKDKGYGEIGPHFHRYIELQYIYEGSVSFTVDNQQILCSDCLLTIFPYQIHSNHRSPDCKSITAIISPDRFNCYLNTLLCFKPSVPILPVSQLTVELMQYAYRIYSADTAYTSPKHTPYKQKAEKTPAMACSDSSDSDDLLDSVFLILLGEALRSFELVQVTDYQEKHNSMITMSQIIGYCMSRLSEKLTIADISHSLFLDKTYISKLFREKLGMNFSEFINRQRVMRACELLRSDSRPILDIAYACGFSNQSSFNRVFREQMHMTPREYRSTTYDI